MLLVNFVEGEGFHELMAFVKSKLQATMVVNSYTSEKDVGESTV